MVLLGDRWIAVAPETPIDERIALVGELQHARMARAQLLAAGVTDAAIKRRLRNGGLERAHAGVYALPNTADRPLGAEAAALLACGADTALSHHSGATVVELRPGIARPVHVTTAHEFGRPKLAGVVVHRSRTLTATDIAIHEGLPVTRPGRTLLDVAATLPDGDLERLLDEALYVKRLVTLADIDEQLAGCGNHPGRWRLARVAGRYSESSLTDSPPEKDMLSLIRAAGLPEPQTRFPMLEYVLDFYWPELALAVEVDTYRTHGSHARFEADRRRDARLLTERGIVVIRFTGVAIRERPFEVIAQLARAIADRAAMAR